MAFQLTILLFFTKINKAQGSATRRITIKYPKQTPASPYFFPKKIVVNKIMIPVQNACKENFSSLKALNKVANENIITLNIEARVKSIIETGSTILPIKIKLFSEK
jgi:hypothetical protein